MNAGKSYGFAGYRNFHSHDHSDGLLHGTKKVFRVRGVPESSVLRSFLASTTGAIVYNYPPKGR